MISDGKIPMVKTMLLFSFDLYTTYIRTPLFILGASILVAFGYGHVLRGLQRLDVS